MFSATKAVPILRKAVKIQLPPEIKRAFVSIPRFLDHDRVMTQLRASCPAVEFKAYTELFTSMDDWIKRRKLVIKTFDALIVAIGSKRNVSHGVVRELDLARHSKRPIFLFNTSTGSIEPFTWYVLSATFPPAENGVEVKQERPGNGPASKPGVTLLRRLTLDQG
jgi:hypothetical protein